jgi:hypothetical protein
MFMDRQSQLLGPSPPLPLESGWCLGARAFSKSPPKTFGKKRFDRIEITEEQQVNPLL